MLTRAIYPGSYSSCRPESYSPLKSYPEAFPLFDSLIPGRDIGPRLLASNSFNSSCNNLTNLRTLSHQSKCRAEVEAVAAEAEVERAASCAIRGPTTQI